MDICYPPDTDWSCRFSETELEAAREDEVRGPKIEVSEALGWSLLASLCAYQIGTCPITVRPCAARCAPVGSYRTAVVGGGSTGALPLGTIGRMSPYLTGGVWLNACGCSAPSDCSCSAISEVRLPGPVGSIVSVYQDGELVPREAYRVDNGGILVRLDGEAWPGCQDMALDAEAGFSVTYYRGSAPNSMTRLAAGVLANEFLLNCEDQACRLPGNVTGATRSGESYTFEPTDYPEGKTGIPEVDAVIRIYNPYGLKTPARVYSPDDRPARVSTWR